MILVSDQEYQEYLHVVLRVLLDAEPQSPIEIVLQVINTTLAKLKHLIIMYLDLGHATLGANRAWQYNVTLDTKAFVTWFHTTYGVDATS